MKRCTCILTSLTLTLLSACSTATHETVPTESIFSKPFSCTANITTDELNAVGTLSRYGDASWEIEFSEPATLSGVTLTFDGTDSEASYKGLSFSIPKSAVPVNSILLCLASAVDGIASSEEKDCTSSEGFLTFKGSTDCGDYTLNVKEDTGDIATFSMKSLNLNVVFSDVNTITIETTATETLPQSVDDTTTTTT